MATCAFFGHAKMAPELYKDKLNEILVDLIENKGVTEFYSGGRGLFDCFSSYAVYELKQKYPFIKMILVLSYYPKDDFELPQYYDESVYLLTDKVPMKFAISKTNCLLVKLADYIVCGILFENGGAHQAVRHAKTLKKPIYNVTGKQIP